jgi:hypothetical protein
MTTRAEALARMLKDYRKAARMPQWVLAELLGLEQSEVALVEAAKPVSDTVEEQVRGYLATAPRPRKLRSVGDGGAPAQHNNIYLTAKLLLWAQKTDMSTEGVEAVRVLKAAYDTAKRDFGLASIPMVQLEVENALTLATRGRYRAMTRPSREMRAHG